MFIPQTLGRLINTLPGEAQAPMVLALLQPIASRLSTLLPVPHAGPTTTPEADVSAELQVFSTAVRCLDSSDAAAPTVGQLSSLWPTLTAVLSAYPSSADAYASVFEAINSTVRPTTVASAGGPFVSQVCDFIVSVASSGRGDCVGPALSSLGDVVEALQSAGGRVPTASLFPIAQASLEASIRAVMSPPQNLDALPALFDCVSKLLAISGTTVVRQEVVAALLDAVSPLLATSTVRLPAVA